MRRTPLAILALLALVALAPACQSVGRDRIEPILEAHKTLGTLHAEDNATLVSLIEALMPNVSGRQELYTKLVQARSDALTRARQSEQILLDLTKAVLSLEGVPLAERQQYVLDLVTIIEAIKGKRTSTE